MQNKARLELADYEAVGTLLLEFKAGRWGKSFLWQFCAAILCFESAFTVSFFQLSEFCGGWSGDIRNLMGKHRWLCSLSHESTCSTASTPRFGQIIQKLTRVSCSQLAVPSLCIRYYHTEMMGFQMHYWAVKLLMTYLATKVFRCYTLTVFNTLCKKLLLDLIQGMLSTIWLTIKISPTLPSDCAEFGWRGAVRLRQKGKACMSFFEYQQCNALNQLNFSFYHIDYLVTVIY